MPDDTLTCTWHVYKPTVRPVASCSLFLDIQVVTLLMGEYTLLAHTNPSTRLPHIFQQYSQHTYMYIHISCDVKEAFVKILHCELLVIGNQLTALPII